MKTITYYLNEVRRRYKVKSDVALGRMLGVPSNHIFNWTHGVSCPNNDAAVKLARLLDRDPMEIIACANYHRVVRSKKRARHPQKNAAQRRFWVEIYNEAAKKKRRG